MPIEAFIQTFKMQAFFSKALHRPRKEWIPITQFRYPAGYIVSGGAVRQHTAFVDYTKMDAKEKENRLLRTPDAGLAGFADCHQKRKYTKLKIAIHDILNQEAIH